MKVLICTKETQGQRDSDFSHAADGEMVYFGLGGCDRDKDDLDGKCGCRRAMLGVEKGGATTTFKVVESDLKPGELFDKIKKAYETGGWGPYMKEYEYRDEVVDLLKTAASFPIGTVLEKRGDTIRVRKGPAKKGVTA